MDEHRTGECAGCEWERQPQAFRWFPELGAPLQDAMPVTDVRAGQERVTSRRARD
ncbi:hypothetical protein [Pseudonocardia sp. DLS-67]